jgi:hypothetical protein
MKGLRVKEFDGVAWDSKDGSLARLNKWISEHDVKQVVLADFNSGYRGFILYKPSKKDNPHNNMQEKK